MSEQTDPDEWVVTDGTSDGCAVWFVRRRHVEDGGGCDDITCEHPVLAENVAKALNEMEDR